jgi:O-acetyl-ADP-ribose deacetylase (regulator of RNase III)
MIEFQRGDILQAETQAVVNPVNCVGVMGRGLALQFRNAFPQNYAAYKTVCDRGELYPGKMFVFEHDAKYIINFPTKRHWRYKSKIEDIQAGLVSLANEVRQRNISSIAIPPLGCGLGGLDWNHVRPLIEQAFSGLPSVRVLVYGP